jgi:hypothetical protein
MKIRPDDLAELTLQEAAEIEQVAGVSISEVFDALEAGVIHAAALGALFAVLASKRGEDPVVVWNTPLSKMGTLLAD